MIKMVGNSGPLHELKQAKGADGMEGNWDSRSEGLDVYCYAYLVGTVKSDERQKGDVKLVAL